MGTVKARLEPPDVFSVFLDAKEIGLWGREIPLTVSEAMEALRGLKEMKD